LDGEMVNARLVQEGLAQVATYPPDVKYQPLFLQLQRQAREAGAGLWSGCGATATASPASSGACDYSESAQPMIKGNISSDGEKIYHVPGGVLYEQTAIDEAAGERWFCTEADAVAAGWRKSRS
jgi:micrococcal nuclease